MPTRKKQEEQLANLSANVPEKSNSGMQTKVFTFFKSVNPAFLVLLLLIVAGLAWNVKLQNEVKKKNLALAKIEQSKAVKTAEDAKQLISQINSLLVLPNNEQPTIATVTDLEKLKDQPFFQNAVIGDKVLIYLEAKKAVLFRPSQNKIVEVAPVNTVGQQSQNQSEVLGASTQPTKTEELLTVEIRNGSGKGGLAALAKNKLAGVKSISVVKLANASKNYSTSQVFVSKPISPAIKSLLTGTFSGQQVSVLPEGEAQTAADILIILGQQ